MFETFGAGGVAPPPAFLGPALRAGYALYERGRPVIRAVGVGFGIGGSAAQVEATENSDLPRSAKNAAEAETIFGLVRGTVGRQPVPPRAPPSVVIGGDQTTFSAGEALTAARQIISPLAEYLSQRNKTRAPPSQDTTQITGNANNGGNRDAPGVIPPELAGFSQPPKGN